MKKSDPAFPQHVKISDDRLETGLAGMSLRDYFAARAMQGLLANSFQAEALLRHCKDAPSALPGLVANISYEQADAMLEARGQ